MGLQLPVGLALEVLDSLLALDDEGEGGGLYASDGEGLLAVAAAIAEGIESGGIHPEEPVADGAR